MIAGGAEMNREMQRVEAVVVQRWGESCWTEVVWGGVCFIASLIAGYTAGWRWVEAAGGARKEAEGREPSGQRCCAEAEQENERRCCAMVRAARAGVAGRCGSDRGKRHDLKCFGVVGS